MCYIPYTDYIYHCFEASKTIISEEKYDVVVESEFEVNCHPSVGNDRVYNLSMIFKIKFGDKANEVIRKYYNLQKFY